MINAIFNIVMLVMIDVNLHTNAMHIPPFMIKKMFTVLFIIFEMFILQFMINSMSILPFILNAMPILSFTINLCHHYNLRQT